MFASLVAAIGLVGCVATIAPTSSPSAAPSAPSVPSTSATRSLEASPVPEIATNPPDDPRVGGTWKLVWPGDDPALPLSSVVETASGWTVVGGDAITGGIALDSPDGDRWTTTRIPSRLGGPSTVIRWDDRLLAVGGGEARCAHPSGADTWVRGADGVWTEAPDVDLLCEGLSIEPLIVDGCPIVVGTGPGDNPVAWSSDDGLHWVDRGGAFAGLLPRGAAGDGSKATAIAWGEAGYFASQTDDGAKWSLPTPVAGLPGTANVNDVFWADGKPAIVASQADKTVLIRPDEAGSWSVTGLVGLRGSEIQWVRPIGSGLVGVGLTEHGSWAAVSADGTTWRPIDLPSDLADVGGFVADLTIRDGRAIVVGTLTNPASGATSGEIWLGPASLLEP